jgi:hypothetical protein
MDQLANAVFHLNNLTTNYQSSPAPPLKTNKPAHASRESMPQPANTSTPAIAQETSPNPPN